MGGGGNWEFQVYVNNRSNSFVEDGKLFLKPTLTSDWLGEERVRGNPPYSLDIWDSCTNPQWYGCFRTSGDGRVINPVTSARIRTRETFSFKYGRVEVRARVPIGKWLWPAIWMLPENQEYGGWPLSGEIDILESRGNTLSVPEQPGCDTATSALHWGAYFPSLYELTSGAHPISSPGVCDGEYHIYELQWTESKITTTVDGNVIMSIDTKDFFEKGGYSPNTNNPWINGNSNAPFDKEFYLIMNLAIGGTGGYWEDGIDGKPWANEDEFAMTAFYNAKDTWLPSWNIDDPSHPSALSVDYVRVYCDSCEYSYEPLGASKTKVGSTTGLVIIVTVVAAVFILGILSAALFLHLRRKNVDGSRNRLVEESREFDTYN